MRRLRTKIAPEKAAKILAEVPPENAFHFYRELGVPIGLVARSLKELLTIIQTVEIDSLQFHVMRGDFENWVTLLGDQSLARQIGRLRKLGITGEALRSRVVEILTSRYEILIVLV